MMSLFAFRSLALTRSSKVVVATLIFSLIFVTFPSSKATAADLSQFQAGNIISDSLFYDGNALNETQVQEFLNRKVPVCTINNGMASHAAGAPYGSTIISDVCLKDYYQQTPNMPEQSGLCAPYMGSTGESAAAIITKVGQACNVSQKVLLVLLEKEQSLITDSWPTVKQISQATGFACYDNGQPCVKEYAGFFYQVWSAARQLQRYGSAPFTWYPVGAVSNVAYQANRPDCGTKQIAIANRATAALYYYTPYTPNDAALSAGYGLGDTCSAYGNRNFFQLYVDWFGSTLGTPGSIAISNLVQQLGGASGTLGSQKSNVMCNLRDGGCWQIFQNGHIFYVKNYGAQYVSPNIRLAWAGVGAEMGFLGYPANSSNCSLRDGGCWQAFENGYVYWSSSTGSKYVLPGIKSSWNSWGNENGLLGYPTSNSMCGLRDGGCWQIFQNGFVFTSPGSGAHVVRPEVRALWATYGAEMGEFGYPTSDPSNSTTTYTQTFQNGTITVTNGQARVTAARDPFLNSVVSNTWLGSPTSGKMCGLRDGGCWQIFQNGFVFTSPGSGAHVVRPEVRALWATYGAEMGEFGYPTSDPSNSTTTYTQTFQNGTITVTNGQARRG